MKTKLTLTLEKSTIEKAKRYSKRTGKSISRMVEEMFNKEESERQLKSRQQIAAGSLLKMLESAPTIKSLGDDKELIRAHLAQKYA